MLRSRNALALLCAVICLFALSSASAFGEALFRIGAGTVATVEGSGANYTFTFGNVVVVCLTERHFDENQGFPTNQVIEKIIYEGCTASVAGLKLASEIVVVEEWNFHSPINATFLGRSLIQIPSIGCTITIPKQEVGTVTYTNEGTNLGVVEAYKGITDEVNEACAKAGIVATKAGTIKGKSLWKAKEVKGSKTVSLEVK